jgi:hypothetical protein
MGLVGRKSLCRLVDRRYFVVASLKTNSVEHAMTAHLHTAAAGGSVVFAATTEKKEIVHASLERMSYALVERGIHLFAVVIDDLVMTCNTVTM